MTQQAIKYGRALYELSVGPQEAENLRKMLEETPVLFQILKSPAIGRRQKKAALDEIARQSGMSLLMLNFLKVLCDLQEVSRIPEILLAYQQEADRAQGVLRAELLYAQEPTPQQLEELKQLLCRRFHARRLELTLRREAALLGGFVLSGAGREYDWSLRGRFQQLRRVLTEGGAAADASVIPEER